ncbi:MAG: hypothetical protein ABR866_11405, partial [Candidatus Korobacteraceae bacterium]
LVGAEKTTPAPDSLPCSTATGAAVRQPLSFHIGLIDGSGFGGLGLTFCAVGLFLTATALQKWTTLLGLTLALMSLGFSITSAWTSCTDIAGKFSATVSGWMNFWGNIVGGAAPIITAWIATRYGWQAAIFTTASTGLLGAVCWIFVKPHKPLQYRSLAERPNVSRP